MAINWNFELTNVLLLLGAVVAAIYARRQVAEMRESNRKLAESGRSQENQLRAGILLTLDARWESPQMMAVRGDLETLIREVYAEALDYYPDRAADIELVSAPYFERRLSSLRDTDSRLQRRLLQICGFFETVGYVTVAGYITLDDVYRLLGGSILTSATVFTPYLDRLLGQGAHPKLYSNFRWLVNQVKIREATSLEA
jgi:hypothetical protein